MAGGGLGSTAPGAETAEEGKVASGSTEPVTSNSNQATLRDAAARAEASVAAWHMESPFNSVIGSTLQNQGDDVSSTGSRRLSRKEQIKLRQAQRKRILCLVSIALLVVLAVAGIMSFIAITSLMAERKGQQSLQTGVSGDLANLTAITDALSSRLTALEGNVEPMNKKVDKLGNDSTELRAGLAQNLRGVANVSERLSALTDTVGNTTKAVDDLKKTTEAEAVENKKAKAALLAEADAKALSVCMSVHEKLLAATPTLGAFICEGQVNWLLACPDKGTPVIVSAQYGRFTDGADGPCSDKGPAASWKACPNTLDLTEEVAKAVAGVGPGVPVAASPDKLLGEGLEAPCPNAYHQLQVSYKCTPDLAEREKDCKALLATTAGPGAAPAPAAAPPAAPAAANPPPPPPPPADAAAAPAAAVAAPAAAAAAAAAPGGVDDGPAAAPAPGKKKGKA